MWRLIAAAWLPVAACGHAALGVFAMPVDLAWATEKVQAVCKTKAPTLKPSNWEAFSAFRSRLGPLYPRYQQWLYDSAGVYFPAAERSQRLAEMKARFEKVWLEALENLQTMAPEEAFKVCKEQSQAWAKPGLEAAIRQMLPTDSKANR